MAISCVYCGAEHDTAAEVRNCFRRSEDGSTNDATLPFDSPPAGPPPSAPARSEGPPADAWFDDELPPLDEDEPPRFLDDEPSSAPRRANRSRPRQSRPAAPVSSVVPGWTPRRGPASLGRHVIVAPGQPAPADWDGCDRLHLDDVTRDPAAAVDRLRRATTSAESLVIELEVDELPLDPPTQRPPHDLGARHRFLLDELHHLVHANAVDVRGSDPVWQPLAAAVALGARPAAPERPGDIVTPDGTPCWVDGGPVRHVDPVDGASVVHAIAIEHGSLRPPGPNESGADLAPDQLAAVTHAGGAARIIAPAGSGKTRVLTERARHLLDVWALPTGAVSLVAFNKRAQLEMVERTADLPGLQVRTLNAIALAVINGDAPFAPQPRRWRTLDERDVRRILGDLVPRSRRRNVDPYAPWIDALSLHRLGLLSPDDVETMSDDVAGVAEVAAAYAEALERAGAVDFDDQIHRAVRLLLTDPEARAAAQRACRVLLVDEFQDLTPAHLLLVRLLSGPAATVFGVGDDDQTIYGYNGADPASLIDYAEIFPGAADHPLQVNYRCPAGVVDVVDRLLRHNRRRVAKEIRAASDDAGGWSIEQTPDPVRQAVEIADEVIGSGAQPSSIAVLTRVNALLVPVAVALAGVGIPVSGVRAHDLLDRTAVGAALAWIRLAQRSSFAADDLREALRRPSRSLHPRIADWVTEQRSGDDLLRLADRLNNERDADTVRSFATDIETARSLASGGASTAQLLDHVLDETGVERSVSTLDANRRGMNRNAQADDLRALRQLAVLHDRSGHAGAFESWLDDALRIDADADGVQLSTVHRVKGLEWPHVIVHLADADQFPHRLATDVEEERRLFHVAVTRASQRAWIVAGPDPSPFIAELTTEPPDPREPERPGPTPRSGGSGSGLVTSAGRRPSGGRGKADGDADLDPADEQLFQSLRTWRREAAAGKPAFTVFPDRTLREIARRRPSSLEQLAAISGVGPAKLEQYGDEVLRVVADHG